MLDACPMCGKSYWDLQHLHQTHGRVKVPAKKFTTIFLGPQLQTLYYDLQSARDMQYLSETTQRILQDL